MSRIISSRHRWCLRCVEECFDLDSTTVENALENQANFDALTSVIRDGGNNKVFVFYQPPLVQNDSGEWVPSLDSTSQNSDTSELSETKAKNSAINKPTLIFTDGTTLPIRRRACYFLRLGPVDSDVSNDSNLVYGEIGSDPLKSLELSLSKLYKPLCDSRGSWGKAESDQTKEFLESCDKVTSDLQDSIKSLVGGLELRKPDKKYDVEARNAAQRPREDLELVAHFEELLEEWCNVIEEYLEGNSDELDVSADAGPLTELEYWRRRMQRLTSITEQLKLKECKNVIGVLSSLTKTPQDSSRQKAFTLLRRWKQVDVNITEAANEAKDNVKYLFTLEKFIEPLYEGTPSTIVDTLPALMNSIKMIHTIARYYNTTERMTTLFEKITNQMINNCKQIILGSNPDFWTHDPELLVKNLESCLKLNEAYQENYRLTKDKLLTMPKGKQFDFSEQQIFGKFDLFCRRVIKLIDMFSTIHQFRSLAAHNLEGMEELIGQFFTIVDVFKGKDHDLLDFHSNKFDRDYVEFNVSISELEANLQQFINSSFESITSIENSLNLLKKFQTILQRENLKSDLDSKFNIIFQNYGLELETVQHLYEKNKHNPPIPRNLPPVSGNIMWSRHLLKRIEEPMKKFESNQNVLSTKDAKRIIKTYNKVARTLVAFEYLWFQAWQQSIETAKAGLQATLIIRHPDDDQLYVNFDQEILQLIREAKCLDRMGIDIPESAKIVLLQEDKFKSYYNDLQYALKEYERVTKRVIPVASKLLEPHIRDMEYKLRPGMITLTWTSMNIDAYKHHIHSGLTKLEELVGNINDIIENRIEKNLKVVSKTVLVDLPNNRSTQLNDFVALQEKRIAVQSKLLHGKNVEVENAVDDLIALAVAYPLDPHVEGVRKDEIFRLNSEYRHKMYCALLKCTKASLNLIKQRIGSRGGSGGFLFIDRPFFEIFVNLQTPKVQITPDLEDVQRAINKSALAVLKCSKSLYDWGQNDLPEAQRNTFFNEITSDLQIAVVCLLLTGSIQGLKNQVNNYLQRFYDYQWLWSDDKDRAYSKFMSTKPSLTQYEMKLLEFQETDRHINSITSVHVIGALSINTSTLKNNLRYEVQSWKLTFSKFLHNQAKLDMNNLFTYIKNTEQRLKRGENIKKMIQSDKESSNSDVLQELSRIMNVLREIRERESDIEQEINPVLDMYAMLERFVGPQGLGDDENDNKEILRHKWEQLVDYAERVTDDLSDLQESFKRKLLRDIKEFVNDVVIFRNEFVSNGPMAPGVTPKTAVNRLRRFHVEYEIRERKYNLYRSGEDLFALKPTEYPELVRTKKELGLLDQLYGLYTDVLDTIEDWKQMEWERVRSDMNPMAEKVAFFSKRCKKMPSKLCDWEAYKDLTKQINDFMVVLPLLQSLAKPSIMQRHWTEVSLICNRELVIGPDFRLQTLLEANLVSVAEEIEEICDGAERQLGIQTKLSEIAEAWQLREFTFMNWKNRDVPVFKGVIPIMEDLEEAQVQLQMMLTMKHVSPFRDEAISIVNELSDTAETLERWLKVQVLWCSLESVFTGGDIAKQLPQEAKKFQKIDKDFTKVMVKAVDQKNVVQCCQNDILKQNLMVFHNELEKCQKSLEGYLEQKRAKFPRFYFVSNPVLLQVLSQGSDPQAVQPFYEKIFDAVSEVRHDTEHPDVIEALICRQGADEEIIKLSNNVRCKGNIESWLSELLAEQHRTMKNTVRECAAEVATLDDAAKLREFVDAFPAQFALLGLQLMWTTDVTNALSICKQRKSAIKDCNAKAFAILSELSSWCLSDLGTKMNRTKIETLVTIQVHQRDVMNDIAALYKAKRISDPLDFEWQKQARFSWLPDDKDQVSPDGSLQVSVTDVEFKYSYEYLGCRDRLVITPLTDRCYITLAQALGMSFGGAPAGPAGTGKTETVKDMGRALGIFVMVQNCTDQMSYKDCGKIFKGLCKGGLWGCFDEFNRITLPVLSVVAQQVLAVQNAKKTQSTSFVFPGDEVPCTLNPHCGFFITMNPGYAGRQELPENLKALFRSVAMMVPDRMIIMKVKLCSVGYSNFTSLAKKFDQLYKLCEEQLSQQKHYDFGLRNILSVLRTCGAKKRNDLEEDEDFLMYRTLRDMNLSKLVSPDVPLFLSLLTDLFPKTMVPPVSSYQKIERAIHATVSDRGLVLHDSWVKKVIQLYETYLVRHGIMLVGPAGGGKSEIFRTLSTAMAETTGVTVKTHRINPKAIRSAEMYGEVDPISGEWTTGVFAAIWAKMNQRQNRFNSWLICDGPVDAIWIEDLNTVLDDNRILTLANGDRIPMLEQNRIMFEVGSLRNASPATVSRAGIIYVSETNLDWWPIVQAWLSTLESEQAGFIDILFKKWIGECSTTSSGATFEFLSREARHCHVIQLSRVGRISGLIKLMSSLLSTAVLSETTVEFEQEIEMMFVLSLLWSIGGSLNMEGRKLFDRYLREIDPNALPELERESDTAYEYTVEMKAPFRWTFWTPELWECPQTEILDFSNLLVPTMDSTRATFILEHMHSRQHPVLMVGGPGTAKTSTAFMFFSRLEATEHSVQCINFSSATTMHGLQTAIENQVDKRGGKNFGPPNGRKMTVFLDDLSMPLVNEWGDQPTLEFVRQLIEFNSFAFLEKDKRGDIKTCEDMQYVGAMVHPGGGRQGIPDRLKRHFLIFNMVLPSITSINDIYGQMISGRFPEEEFAIEANKVLGMLTSSTINLWQWAQRKFLPTPNKFHYVFNMREVSRVFQGILACSKEAILFKDGNKRSAEEQATLVASLWHHECERVFCDKLVDMNDKEKYKSYVEEVIQGFGKVVASQVLSTTKSRDGSACRFCNFLREGVVDEDGDEVVSPFLYEVVPSEDMLLKRVSDLMSKYTSEVAGAQPLVMFSDALDHLLRISRVLMLPRASALLVGVGGSGKQSLVRLASFISGSHHFQIKLRKQYSKSDLLDDLRVLFRIAGQERRAVTFLFTEQEIKEDSFLEILNTVMMTGEVPGLFSKEEMLVLTADLEQYAVQDRPGFSASSSSLRKYFFDKVRDNLHVILCMSPASSKFGERARMFPGLINCCTIDWFLSWPESALQEVARGYMTSYSPCDSGMYLVDDQGLPDADMEESLIKLMGSYHVGVTEICEDYDKQLGRKVYQTPKSYMSFITAFKASYETELKKVNEMEQRIKLGLAKLTQGASDVKKMEEVLKEEEVKLQTATEETNSMIGELEVKSLEAKKESDKVMIIQRQLEKDASRIQSQQQACQEDLAQAQPYLDEAVHAIASIKAAHLNEIKNLKNPADIIQLVFDGVLLLFKEPLVPVKPAKLTIKKKDVQFVETSFAQAKRFMGENFLKSLFDFGDEGKNLINDETIELMAPYLELENFTPVVAKTASAAAEGLCTWVRAMQYYHEASKIVKPKMEALQVAEAQLEEATEKLTEASAKLSNCKQRLSNLQKSFDEKLREKANIEEGAKQLQKKMNQASSLINGLSEERTRWSADMNRFTQQKRCLVGDVAVSCAFVSYCGPFDQHFRDLIVRNLFVGLAEQFKIPVTPGVDPTTFLADSSIVADWNVRGLPSDSLSTQNGILVTQSSRFPLVVDPQGQAIGWICSMEKAAGRLPNFGVLHMNNPKLKEHLEFAMGEGLAMVITGVQEGIDPMFDPVLEKQVVRKGKSLYVNLGEKSCAYHPNFNLYFISRLPNPHFPPELQAKVTVVDFTVTLRGLEDQLLARVIGKEQGALQDQLEQVIEEVATNTRLLMQENELLLMKLTSNSGSLLDDDELVGVLKKVKNTAEKVTNKLNDAEDTRLSINEKREQYRPVATRGAVLYFTIVETSKLNVMYQTSLQQFLDLFMRSMDDDHSMKNNSVKKRVANIVDALTTLVHRYVNRGLFENDKLTFLLIMAIKILMVDGDLSSSDIHFLLRGGVNIDINAVRRKPYNWLSDESWCNLIALSNESSFFGSLPDEMTKSEQLWKAWYEDSKPETISIPDFEDRIMQIQSGMSGWHRLQLVRALRHDRLVMCARNFIKTHPKLGSKYVEPVTDVVESVFQEMNWKTPVIYLLSTGADPTDAIQALCSRKKKTLQVVSMGQGQESVALKGLENGIKTGNWLLLQNCELGLGLMNDLEEILKGYFEKGESDTFASEFRLFFTASPHPSFPLGLLQMCTKVTNEPPAGLRAGLLRSYTVTVDQDRMDRVDSPVWRQMLFNICFLHSIAQERRKFGALGWSIPYEFNSGDITACILFLEKHLYASSMSWPTLQYMVSEVQYGGKITDDLDRRLLTAYAERWMSDSSLQSSFMYNSSHSGDESGFKYVIPNKTDHSQYLSYIQQLPEDDSPVVFGLHPNADLTFRTQATESLLANVAMTQPRASSGTNDGGSVDETLKTICDELMEKLPIDFVMEDVQSLLDNQGGMGVPLNIFLLQEVEVLQAVLTRFRENLKELLAAIDGDVVMTSELSQIRECLLNGEVFSSWVWTVGGDEFSWLSSSVTKWVQSMVTRFDQFNSWLNDGRPSSFWIPGFKNPNGFLTAMKQEVTRLHKADGWALDDVVYHTDVSDYETTNNVKGPPREGVLVHGLYLDGASWSGKGSSGTVTDPVPNQIYFPLPLLHITGYTRRMEAECKENYGTHGPYECPLYKYKRRTDRYKIIMVSLSTREMKPSHWVLRGTALTCSIDM